MPIDVNQWMSGTNVQLNADVLAVLTANENQVMIAGEVKQKIGGDVTVQAVSGALRQLHAAGQIHKLQGSGAIYGWAVLDAKTAKACASHLIAYSPPERSAPASTEGDGETDSE